MKILNMTDSDDISICRKTNWLPNSNTHYNPVADTITVSVCSCSNHVNIPYTSHNYFFLSLSPMFSFRHIKSPIVINGVCKYRCGGGGGVGGPYRNQNKNNANWKRN